MTQWACGIHDCGAGFDTVEKAILHQATEHDRQECAVCGTVVPDGYFAIRHAFDNHTRAEFIRAYDTNADAVRERERIKDRIEQAADLQVVVQDLRDEGALG